MRKYWLVFTNTLQDTFEYRFDFLIHIIKYTFAVGLMAFVWIAALENNTDPQFSADSLVRYFFFAAMLFSLSNFHTWYVEEDIKLGQISKYLVKPLSMFSYYFSYQTARNVIDTTVKVTAMVPLLWLLGFGFPVQLINLLIFLAYLPLVSYFSFSVQFTISSLAFWLNEVYSLRWTALTITRTLSGILIPVSLLPQWWLNISTFLPFEHLAYTPIQLITNQYDWQTGIQGWLILLAWTGLAVLVRELVWQKGAHSFEATGL